MLPGKTYTPEDVLKIGWHSKWIVVVPFVLATAATVVGLHFVPDQYRSETLILVVPQRVNENFVRPSVNNRIDERLQSISQQILSRTRLESIIDELGLYQVERPKFPMEDIVARMREDIEVETVRGDAFRVSFIAFDPAIAQKVTERLASLFIEENLRDREALAEATNQFLDSQLEEARARLVEHEKKLEAFRLQHAGELPTQAQGNMQALQSLQVQQQGLTDSVARDRDRRLMIQRQIAELTRVSTDSASVPKTPTGASGEGNASETAAQALMAARRQLELLEMRLTPEHPDIIRAKRIIRDLEVKAEEERKAFAAAAAAATRPVSAPRTLAERALADLGTELEAVKANIESKEGQLARIDADIESYRARLRAIPTRESEMTALMRDYDTLRSIYTDLLGKREASKVAANLERRQIGEQFRVLDPAKRPEVPFSPSRQRVTAMGAAAGLALGLGLVVLLELRDRSLRSEADIVAVIGLPVLATIPRMFGEAERRRRRRVVWSGGAAALTIVVAAAAVALRFLQ
jgi:polysaccharide chain length determinant protein (PEP-CTERM system associated)